MRRGIKDEIKQPSTFEQAKRAGVDILDDLEKEVKDLKQDVKDIFTPIVKAAREGLKGVKDAAEAGGLFEKLHENVPLSKNVSFTKDLKDFLKSMGTMFASIVKNGKEQDKAWTDLKKATSKLVGTIQKTLSAETGIGR